jgi:ribosomal-protein-alanine N-acetyltransferase
MVRAMPIRLEGEQVILRPVNPDDVDDIAKNARNKQISRNTFMPHPYRPEHAIGFLRHAQKVRRTGSGLHLAVVLKEKNEVVGMLGFEGIVRNHRRAEIGYWIGKRFWGRGIATEMVQLAVDYGFREMKLNRIQAGVFIHNPASSRVLEKCGFSHEGTLRQYARRYQKYVDMHMYSILRHEWQRLKKTSR